MTEPDSQNEKSKEERRYDPELLKKGLRCDLDQYEMLKRCSDKKDITEWHHWRKKYPNEEIWLEGADLSFTYLENAYLKYAKLKEVFLGYANLNEAKLRCADLEGTKGAYIRLKGTDLLKANIKGATLIAAIVDGSTIFWKCEVDKETNFEGVALDSCRIDPATKQLLEYNIRREIWKKWYIYKDWQTECKKKRHVIIRSLMYLIRWFWSFSDYGWSTWRIIGCFFGLALFFAAIYSFFAFLSPPGIVSNLEIEPHLPLWHYGVLVFIRPIYFSIVTMTTLGFGDMYANAQSIWGHILLTFQVILGYVLLGALVTRFAVLFTAGGPAGKFADEKEKEDKKK